MTFSLLLLVSLLASSSSVLVSAKGSSDYPISVFGRQSSGTWMGGLAVAPSPQPDSPQQVLVLAADRTKRPDILRGFKSYRNGWNITDTHYWSSVGFTGAAGFILAFLWCVLFGLVLSARLCCGWRMKLDGEVTPKAQRTTLILLILFTSAAAIGCILLSIGQDEFHNEVLDTLKYVVNQSDYAVQTLRNVTEYLNLAKSISVAQVFIPSDVMDDIDKLDVRLNYAAYQLQEKTYDNARKIKKVFNLVKTALIVVAAVMLLLALIGLVLSLCGHHHSIYIFIVSGWLLVTVTFILCAVFMILHNAVSDTCVAMEQWVDNPQAESSLSNILPCVDQQTTNQTLYKSKVVVNDIVNVVNQFIYTYANTYQSGGNSLFYNQSGPLLPPLCYPYDGNMQERQCTSQEVSSQDASQVWENYVCQVSATTGLCTTPGRLTPDIYTQMVAAANESHALDHYAPVMLDLQNCNFVRDAFQGITTRFCPPLGRYLKLIEAGLGLISAGVMLCLFLWTFFANRPRREEAFANSCLPIKSFGRRHTVTGSNPTVSNFLSPPSTVP
uniref:Uncharacterized protein n=1 Tax=Kalanchoe fedtschenkoi TaxID=63787 RepID=A0A7N1A735_KALFE